MSVVPRLDVASISKTFGPVKVLDDVCLQIVPGEVHGLVGQNGSGKSTLIKVITGIYTPDSGGAILVDGVPLDVPVAWTQAHHAGVSVVHQSFGLLDHLTVTENICVGGYPTDRSGRISRSRSRRMAEETLARLEADIDPGARVAELSTAQRAEVAIARALRDLQPGSGVIILDESTRTLVGADLDAFHRILRRIVATGTSALLVTHSLSELVRTTDRTTVLRDGRVVAAGVLSDDLTEASVAKLMTGMDVPPSTYHGPGGGGRPRARVATVSGLHGARLTEVDLQVDAGEVVGITGVPGSGFEDLPYLISGARPASAGSVTIDGTQVDATQLSVRSAMKLGVGLVPERRDVEGLAESIDVQSNVMLPQVGSRSRPWRLARGWQSEGFTQAVGQLDIRPADPKRLAGQLSGGNQQKALVAKWLATKPTLLVLVEPTQAVDVSARHKILTTVREAADTGTAVVLASTEPADLAQICDRVLIYRPGEGLTPIDHSTPELILDAVYGSLSTTGTPQ